MILSASHIGFGIENTFTERDRIRIQQSPEAFRYIAENPCSIEQRVEMMSNVHSAHACALKYKFNQSAFAKKKNLCRFQQIIDKKPGAPALQP